ncbi:MAG: bifunctional pyr operon transcriptional regulator/uracil phosphoribosyltransferase PyrR [Oscillospiraceae bacterium]|nr:bifunctional pyr operon transcriptional regulator/uracil phosphoribosyltransferase PyrR [Candidatus Limimonas coprohippi]MCQ2488233.1 bifunctional pyr operon transcriptional regulator/uracil phosphoribosyltransferase PyrR [Clostridia bacterium]
MANKVIFDETTMEKTLTRLSHEIIERNPDSVCLSLIGIKRRGVPLARTIKENIEKFSDINVELGELDITFYRDDLSMKYSTPHLNDSSIDFDINGKTVILVDDVLYTGRTARAAMDAVMSIGRPQVIQLAVMVDRGHRELPIAANYVGKNIPTSKDEFISVRVFDVDGINEIAISDKALIQNNN